MGIRLGTDGWRGIISADFTFANVALVARAASSYYLSLPPGDRTVVVGYDTRFLSLWYARKVAGILGGSGLKVYLTEKPVTSPVLSFTVRHLGAAGGIMITASHNPPEYNGIKFKGPYGGSALPALAAELQQSLDALGSYADELGPVNLGQGSWKVINPDRAYFNHLKSLVDLSLIRRTPTRVIIDPMYGAGQGYLKTLLDGLYLEVIEIHNQINPSFGGINPEPIEANLSCLKNVVLDLSGQVGLALDGDGDRLGAVTEKGAFVDAQHLYALLLQHLVEDRGCRGKVVKTFSTTGMVDRLAARYHLPLVETPIGFKYICEHFLAGGVLMGGEESGGFGFANHIPERDGVLAGLMILEMMSQRGKSLQELIDELKNLLGPHHYERIDLHLKVKTEGLPQRLKASPPANLDGLPVSRVQDLDGVKFFLDDGSWLLIRPSGTEPVVRIYAESPDQTKTTRLITAGQLLVNTPEV